MNRLILEPWELSVDGTALINGHRAKHLLEVCKMQIGSQIKLGVVNSRIGSGQVLTVNDGKVRLEVRLDGVEPKPQPLTVILAMPRPQMLRRILQKAATFGVQRLVLFRSSRVEKSYFSSPLLRADSIRSELIVGLEQGGGTVLPEVVVFTSMRELLAAGELDGEGEKLLLDLSGERTLLDYPNQEARRIFLIGPEGGFLPDEVALFEQRGFSKIRVAKNILRVESAFDFALAQSELLSLNMSEGGV